MTAPRIISDLSRRFADMHGRPPDSDELILTLAHTVTALAQLVSPGYARWPAPHLPPRPQRPQILDGGPETATE